MHVDTDHGAYDALPKRDQDGGPFVAQFAVFHDSGEMAGFARRTSARPWCGDTGRAVAWNAAGHGIGPFHATLEGAIGEVAGHHGSEAVPGCDRTCCAEHVDDAAERHDHEMFGDPEAKPEWATAGYDPAAR